MQPKHTKNLPHSKFTESGTISCECGTGETNETIQCHVCQNWQHAQCYAYQGQHDAKLTAEHMCYTCLLGNTASKHLDEVVNLTRARQMIHCVQVRSMTSPAKIAKTLGKQRKFKWWQ